jgi:pyruvate dehydrogenase E2 component (dihydrolipoamide acetyltransferase)
MELRFMPTSFIMPKFDMDQETATVVEWLKNDGDHIELDESVLTVETDKVAIEVPAPATGTLARVSVGPGDIVPVTTVIAYILAEGESEGDLPPESIVMTKEATPAEEEPSQVVEEEIPAKVQPGGAEPVTASPVAARMAQSLGINLAEVSAEGGRVTKDDIEAYLKATPSLTGRVKIASTPAARRLAGDLGVDLAVVQGSGPHGRLQADDVKAFAETAAPDVRRVERAAELIPLVGIRRTIAERMQTSFQEAPHIALTVGVDVTQLEVVRARMNELATQRDEKRISITALLVRIVAWALTRHPYINASLIEETIYLWNDFNIGVATAIQDGLIVPVIRNADRKTVSQINEELKDLTQRARDSSLTLDAVKGGTFTISNLGMFGINQFRAVINPPESALLAVGNVVRTPVVINEQDEIAVRPMMAVTLSADHRVIDGVTAAKFLADLVGAIETPDLLLY